MNHLSRWRPCLAAAAAAPLIGLAPAFAADEPATAADPNAVAPLSAGRVVRDPATGQLRAPEHDEVAAKAAAKAAARSAPNALGRAAARSSSPVLTRLATPREVVTSNGTRIRSMDINRLSFAVVTRGPDGQLTSHCVQGEDAATHAQHSAALATAKEDSHAQ